MPLDRRTLLSSGVAALAVPLHAGAIAPHKQRGYLGSYTYGLGEGPVALGTHRQSEGIHAFDLDSRTGIITGPWLAARQPSPTNLIVDPARRLVYACQGGDTSEARITALAADGATLRPINSVPSGGSGPTHGAIDRRGRFLVTTNFSSDEVVAFRLSRGGGLAEMTARMPTSAGPKPPPPPPGSPMPAMSEACRTTARDLSTGCRTKPHIALFSPSEKWVLAAEIATDAVAVYRFGGTTGSLVLHSLAQGQQGGGPRHLAWGHGGRFFYSSDEHGSQVSVWRWDDRRGMATRLQSLSTLPAGFAGPNTTAHIAVHPGGGALWVSNRGHPSIAGFAIDPVTGLVTAMGHTLTGSRDCWCFDIDRTGQWLIAALMSTDELAVFRINSRSAALERTPQRITTPFPTCLGMAWAI